jgi:AcrR family transcriptional regulator
MTAVVRSRSPRGEGDRLREEILAATQRLLMETGSAEAVSIRAVARAVGVTSPAIYRHFEDKDRLLLEACREKFQDLQVALEAAEPQKVPVGERMLVMGRSYIDFALENPESYRIMFMTRFDMSAQHFAEEMMGDRCFMILLDSVTDLIDAGLVRPELADKGALHVGGLFWASIHGLASLLIAKPGLPWPDREQLITDLLHATVRGIQVAPKPSRRRS